MYLILPCYNGGLKKVRKQQELVIYRDAKGDVKLRADMDKETIWATLDQIAEVFGTKRPAITKHFNNIFNSGELERGSVCSILEHTAGDGKTYKTQYYNLDAILSVGYRVNSKQATTFRQWATKTLRDYIIKGYAVNAKRLQVAQHTSVKELEKTLQFIQGAIRRKQLDQKEVDSLLSVIGDYANSWIILQKYDQDELVLQKGKGREQRRFDYSYVRPAVNELKKNLVSKDEATELFASERDQSFQGILGNFGKLVESS